MYTLKHRIRPHIPICFAILSAIFFGSCAPMTKFMLGPVEPVMVAALFYLGSGIGIFLMIVARRLLSGPVQREAPLDRHDIPALAGMALFGGILAPVVLTFSMTVTPAATGALLLNFEPVATTLVAFFLFREAVGRQIWTAMLFIAGSCIILSYEPSGAVLISAGAVGILVACTFWAFDNNISRRVSGKDPLVVIFVKGFSAGLVTLLVALLLGEHIPALSLIPVYLTVGFFSFGGIASVFFLIALRSLGTARTGLFLALSPFFGVIISFILFREIPGLQFVPAFGIMILGTWLLLSERHDHLHYHPPMVHDHRHRHPDSHHEHEHPASLPPLSSSGDHAHLHTHAELTHAHPHKPDLHHQHDHRGRSRWYGSNQREKEL